MDCTQAQNDLLSAESLTLLAPELSAHIAECADCQALLAKLRRLDAETRALPVPPGHEQPSPEFLRQIIRAAADSGSSMRRGIRRLIAAAVVLAFALAATSLIFFNGPTVQADVLIGQLVDWNLAIAHSHDTASRIKVYQRQASELQKQIIHEKLAPADRALALALLDNAQWMTTEENAAEESQHFQSLANQLLQRQHAASDGAATHLQQIYQELINQGVSHGNGSATSPSSQRQNSTPTQNDSSSASSMQTNGALAGVNAMPTIAMAAKSTNAALAPASYMDFSEPFFAGGDTSSVNLPHAPAADTGAMHATGVHAHHPIAHVSPNNPGASSTDSTHTAPAQPGESSPPISRSDADSISRAADSTLPPPPPPSQAAAPVQQFSAWEKSSLWSSAAHLTDAGPLASLRTLDAFHLFGHADPPPDWDSGIAEQTTSWISLPPDAPEVPLSRYAMASLLAEHINDGSFAGSDLGLRDPPPMGAETREFFSGGDSGAPVPFPEPALGLLPLVGLLGLRRRRRGK